ncbi:tetratricopeptide repeat protein [Marinobacter xestospongiae]|uniref:Tetratricopeptide repeat protein n=1 Tax=Marinobacter xestospongiae TaxID=994319 RepID=A0ABU3W0Q3_9GAMM|nr:tetratricopeptide repeat protein [Marinobacter xestospongiae]MDV2080094.1 tetratricopeptide repeat protein [Marinobacter xestospongiae]
MTRIAKFFNCLFLISAMSASAETEQKNLQEELELAERLLYGGDEKQAYTRYKMLAEQGCAKAQVRLGRLMDSYEPERNTEALAWIRRSAEQGYAHAQYTLGFAYDMGMFGLGPREFERAKPWYFRAAAQGHPAAMEAIAYMYLHGQGGLKHDLVSAYQWFTLAARRFPPSTDKPAYGMGANNELRQLMLNSLDRLATRMSSAQIAEANRRIEDWENAHNNIHRMPETSETPLPIWYNAIEAGCND